MYGISTYDIQTINTKSVATLKNNKTNKYIADYFYIKNVQL